MPTIACAPLLESLTLATHENLEAVRVQFVNADTHALGWKPDPKRWSAIECFEHLNIALRHYVPELQRRLQANQHAPASQYQTGWIGNRLAHAVHPDQRSKPMKAPRLFHPQVATLDTDTVLAEYLEHATVLVDLLAQSRQAHLGKVRITSAIGNILRFRLGDALRFVVYHNQRHTLQAADALALANGVSGAGFPIDA